MEKREEYPEIDSKETGLDLIYNQVRKCRKRGVSDELGHLANE